MNEVIRLVTSNALAHLHITLVHKWKREPYPTLPYPMESKMSARAHHAEYAKTQCQFSSTDTTLLTDTSMPIPGKPEQMASTHTLGAMSGVQVLFRLASLLSWLTPAETTSGLCSFGAALWRRRLSGMKPLGSPQTDPAQCQAAFW